MALCSAINIPHGAFFLYIVLVHERQRFRQFIHQDPLFFILAFHSIVWILAKIMYMMTCHTMEILSDFRFISILSSQVIGFLSCLFFAYKLGGIIGNKTSIKLFDDKTSSVPRCPSFVINLK